MAIIMIAVRIIKFSFIVIVIVIAIINPIRQLLGRGHESDRGQRAAGGARAGTHTHTPRTQGGCMHRVWACVLAEGSRV